jgi:hypothetical protein
MRTVETYDELLDELVSAIELREVSDPDARDWSVESRIRRLELALVERHRVRPGRLTQVMGQARDEVLAGSER